MELIQCLCTYNINSNIGDFLCITSPTGRSRTVWLNNVNGLVVDKGRWDNILTKAEYGLLEQNKWKRENIKYEDISLPEYSEYKLRYPDDNFYIMLTKLEMVIVERLSGI